MSVFNYRTRRDTLEGLAARVGKLEKLLRNLKFWEVNDSSQGFNILRRRKVTPSVALGTVGRGNWFNVTGLNNNYGGNDSNNLNRSDYGLGFTISKNVVTVKSGYLFHGTRTPITIPAKDVSILADNTYIYVTYTYGSGVATIISSLTFPQHTATTLNWLLFKVTLANSLASVETGNIYSAGNIHIPGNFA